MLFRECFERSLDTVPFNNAGLSLMTIDARQALEEVTRDATNNFFKRLDYWVEQYTVAHQLLEKIVGCESNCLAFIPNVATGLTQAAYGLPLEEGDEILSWEGEYPTNTYPWIAVAKEKKAKYISVPLANNHEFSTEKLLEAINSKTKIVAISWVQFQNGYIAPLKKISEACKKVGAYLVVDAIQGLGILPFNMLESGADIVCGGTYKWLCGPIGLAFMAVRKDLIPQMTPIVHGAMAYTDYEELKTDREREPHTDYRRFEPGAPYTMLAHAAAASIKRILEFGVININAKALRLSDELIGELRSADYPILSPSEGPLRSPIVNFIPKGDLSKVSEKLFTAGISHAVRMGGLRISPHVYNTPEDVEKLLDCVKIS